MDAKPQANVTAMLAAMDRGEDKAAAELFPIVYGELRRVAAVMMADFRPGQTLQPTALVHEAFVKMLGAGAKWQDRRHFFNAAARAMRWILRDQSKRKGAQVHGGGRERVDLGAIDLPASRDFDLDQVEALEQALDELEGHNARWSELVHLRYFAGLSVEQAAETMDVSRDTAAKDWRFARAWLLNRVGGTGAKPRT